MKVDTVAVYWKARAESAEACAGRLDRYFRELAQAFPSLAEWYKQGGSRAAASAGTSVSQYDESALVDLVKAGANKRDIGKEVIEELGFQVGLWNKRKEGESMGLSIACGLSFEHPGMRNAVVMDLPSDLGALSLDSDESLKKLLLVQVAAWNPDWGAVFSTDELIERKGRGPLVDKMLWISDGETAPETIAGYSTKEQTLGGTLYMSE